MIKLYGHELSGNCYKVKLMLALINADYEWISVDLLKGEQRSAEFLAINSFGQVPVLIDDTVVIADAQAILVYLARSDQDDRWLPVDAEPMSRVIRWLAIAASEIRQGPESARLYHLFKLTSIDIDRARQKSEFILTQLNQHLANREWLESDHPTIADIAVFPYIALAPDGRISLDGYPYILNWIERIKQLPGFVGMPGIAKPATTA
jgi:glutathione S-transferase